MMDNKRFDVDSCVLFLCSFVRRQIDIRERGDSSLRGMKMVSEYFDVDCGIGRTELHVTSLET